MPQLPTITISNQTAFDRIVAAFPGSTQAEKAASYREWLKKAIRDEVVARESAAVLEACQAAADAKYDELKDIMNSAS